MGGYEKMGTDIEKSIQQDDGKSMNIGMIKVEKANNILDRTISQMIIDSTNENDEPLKIIDPIFDSKQNIEHLNVDDSLILKLAYMK